MGIRRLSPDDAAAYRALMLRTYAEASEAFVATVAEREPMPLDWWAARLSDRPEAPTRVLGAFVGDQLAGVAGLGFQDRERTKHKATLFSVAVDRPHRGHGIARALVEAALDHARSVPGVRVVQLTVAETNATARALYATCGFAVFGTEPMGLRLGERFVPLVHMACDLGPDAPPPA